MSADVWYLDSSALVKLVLSERESAALGLWLVDKERLVACDLVRVETIRAIRMSDPGAVPRAQRALATLTLIRLDDAIYDLAARLDPVLLRSLDAIHLAAARGVGDDLAGVVTYDARMTEAARGMGLMVESPGPDTEKP